MLDIFGQFLNLNCSRLFWSVSNYLTMAKRTELIYG